MSLCSANSYSALPEHSEATVFLLNSLRYKEYMYIYLYISFCFVCFSNKGWNFLICSPSLGIRYYRTVASRLKIQAGPTPVAREEKVMSAKNVIPWWDFEKTLNNNINHVPAWFDYSHMANNDFKLVVKRLELGRKLYSAARCKHSILTCQTWFMQACKDKHLLVES